ncbi:hypothetical protein H0H93_013525 [Arthromyces matolae]|nr:hypothetical protein H0H93_013525 [Arthromyces matolae]
MVVTSQVTKMTANGQSVFTALCTNMQRVPNIAHIFVKRKITVLRSIKVTKEEGEWSVSLRMKMKMLGA